MSANLSSCNVLRVALPNATQQTIAVSDFAPQGCAVRDITLEVTTAVGGSAVTITGGGNTLVDGAVATTPAGGYQVPLTATSANLQLSSTDTLVINPSGATVIAVNIFFGDYIPTNITVS